MSRAYERGYSNEMSTIYRTYSQKELLRQFDIEELNEIQATLTAVLDYVTEVKHEKAEEIAREERGL